MVGTKLLNISLLHSLYIALYKSSEEDWCSIVEEVLSWVWNRHANVSIINLLSLTLDLSKHKSFLYKYYLNNPDEHLLIIISFAFHFVRVFPRISSLPNQRILATSRTTRALHWWDVNWILVFHIQISHISFVDRKRWESKLAWNVFHVLREALFCCLLMAN